MRIFRRYRWPLGFGPTSILYILAATAGFYYGIPAYFRLMMAVGGFVHRTWGVGL